VLQEHYQESRRRARARAAGRRRIQRSSGERDAEGAADVGEGGPGDGVEGDPAGARELGGAALAALAGDGDPLDAFEAIAASAPSAGLRRDA
jgi:hypothetical protein